MSQETTHAVENFRHKLNNMKASGDTAIWDSIVLAQDQLLEYAKQYLGAKLRIVRTSDGVNNRTKNEAHGLPSSLFRNNVVVDSFCLGKEYENTDLTAVSYLTGGYVFRPMALEEAMPICEMEPVLSLLERPDKSPKGNKYHSGFLANPDLYHFYLAQEMGRVEEVSRDKFPECKEHPQLSESFVRLDYFNRSISANRTGNNMRLSRIHNEIRNSGAQPHPHYDIFICGSNMGLLKVVMQGKPLSLFPLKTF